MAVSIHDVLRALVRGDRALLHDAEWVDKAVHAIGEHETATAPPAPAPPAPGSPADQAELLAQAAKESGAGQDPAPAPWTAGTA